MRFFFVDILQCVKRSPPLKRRPKRMSLMKHHKGCVGAGWGPVCIRRDMGRGYANGTAGRRGRGSGASAGTYDFLIKRGEGLQCRKGEGNPLLTHHSEINKFAYADVAA